MQFNFSLHSFPCGEKEKERERDRQKGIKILNQVFICDSVKLGCKSRIECEIERSKLNFYDQVNFILCTHQMTRLRI